MTTELPSYSQAERAYEEIRRRILILEIRPEERLKEQEWAQKLQVGRIGVREALTRLQGESFVTRGEKGGFFAAAMGPEEVREIREVREVLETSALRLAAGRMTKAEIKELGDACDDFAYMVKKGYATGACEADRRFHHLLVSASKNRKLVHAYEHCHIPLFHIIMGRSREYMDDYAETEREHREILNAIKADNFAKAEDLLRKHFARGEKAALGKAEGAGSSTS